MNWDWNNYDEKNIESVRNSRNYLDKTKSIIENSTPESVIGKWYANKKGRK